MKGASGSAFGAGGDFGELTPASVASSCFSASTSAFSRSRRVILVVDSASSCTCAGGKISEERVLRTPGKLTSRLVAL